MNLHNMRIPFKDRHLFIWIAVSVLVSIFVAVDAFPDMRRSAVDTFFVPSAPADNIVLVKIDDASLREIGQWPWPRAVFADILAQLDAAAVVGIDVHFQEASRLGAEDDQALFDGIARSKPAVVLGVPIDSLQAESDIQRRLSLVAERGFSNLLADNDGTIRRMMPVRDDTPSFAYAVARESSSVSVPRRTTRVNFRGPNQTYPAFSFVDILNNPEAETLVRGKTVLIGVTASDLQNFHRTPFGFMSGVEVQANMVDTIQSNAFYREHWIANVAAVLILSFLTVVVSVSIRRFGWLLLSLLGIIAMYVIIAAIGFANFFIIDLLYPLASVLLTALVINISQYVVVAKREQAVRQSFTYLAAMVESLQDGVLLTDAGMRVRVANAAARNVFDIDNTQPVTLDVCAAALSDQLDLKAELRTGMQQRTFQQVDDVLIGDRYFQVFAGPIVARTSSNPSIVGGVVIFHDITQQKEIERIREDFISMMVHELRSPLGAINKITHALRDGDVDKPKRRDAYLEIMETNASDMLTLVNDLLDVAKIEAGKFDITKEETNIRDIIKKRKEFFAESAKEKGIALKSVVAREVPKRVMLDGTRIGQVLNNLISNALKFVEDGGHVTLHAFVAPKGADVAEIAGRRNVPFFEHTRTTHNIPRGPLLAIAVADTGQGMAPEDLGELFNKFKQFEQSARSKSRGTGLGLAITKGITEAHGGSVLVTSEKGTGTTFFLLIPLEEAEESKRSTKKQAS